MKGLVSGCYLFSLLLERQCQCFIRVRLEREIAGLKKESPPKRAGGKRGDFGEGGSTGVAAALGHIGPHHRYSAL